MNKRKCEFTDKCSKYQKVENNIKCFINLHGKSNKSFIIFFPKEYFMGDGNSLDICNKICDLFPDNNWKDIQINTVNYYNEKNIIDITCY